MGLLNTVVCLLYMSAVSGLIMPLTKTDGTLDLSSLLSHIALMEQTIENKASAVEVEKLRSDLTASQKELVETKTKLAQVETKLETTTDELKEVKDDLKKAEMEIVLLKSQGGPKDNTSSDVSHLKTNVSHLTTDMSQIKTAVSQLTTNVAHLTDDVSQLRAEVFQVQALQNKTEIHNIVPGAVTFTRWGRTSCPQNSDTVYKGYTGGTYVTDKASSASILCLPEQPIYANHTDSQHDNWHGSHIFGTEYESYYDGAPFRSLHQEDMPCVVCEIRSKTSVIMLPARNQCYSGWTLEYSGYLLGPSFNWAAGEYICVDSDAEAIPGGHEDKNGQVLYPVEGRCGSLPCPPYHDFWELTCAVCSK